MIQFTPQEIQRLRSKAAQRPELIASLEQSVRVLMEEDVLAPETGIANWQLYYYCPSCSVHLSYNRHDGKHHRCPQCGAVYTGEPYDSSWWAHVNSQNYKGAVTLGQLYVMTGRAEFAKAAGDILLTYARRYPNYQEHGDIPYNGPGRSGAQTLDEANFQRNLAIAYDMVGETLSKEERDLIRDQLFLPGAAFLMEHRHNQLHNHEVIINSAIATIGLIFGREELVDFALYTPYGMVYQLEHGMLENGMWFEGSFGYHFYALESFLAYEKFALHTAHSHIRHPNYAKMMNVAYDYLQPDGELPLLGDTKLDHFDTSMLLYEFTYRELRTPRMLAMLHSLYARRERDSLEALIYGADELPPCPQIQPEPAFHPQPGQSGCTVLRAPGERYLLFKLDRYGGEHDHYDRLALSYLAWGEAVAPDLGTTGYGAVLHYDYYKNTGSHNTVVIGEENQAPANAVLTRFEERDGIVYVEAQCDWTAPYEKLDSFTIAQWNEEAYETVKMTRRIAWTPDYFAEVFLVEGVENGRTIDWVMHFSGERVPMEGEAAAVCFSQKKPFKYIHDVTHISGREAHVHEFAQNGVVTRVHSAAYDGETYLGTGPHNPSYKDIQYLIERVDTPGAVFAHVIESGKSELKIEHVAFEMREHGVRIEITDRQGKKRSIEM